MSASARPSGVSFASACERAQCNAYRHHDWRSGAGSSAAVGPGPLLAPAAAPSAAAAGEEAWAPWLDSLPTDFDAFAYLDCEDVDKWVQETAQRWGLPADRLAETLGERRGAYARRAAWFFSDEGPAALCGASPESFRLAYCRVLSRAVTVDGKGCIGLVPFYDFLNHGRLGSEANVELLTYGQAVRRAGDASGAEGSFLDLDDMLLVATADIETGAELLTGYADAGADEDGYRVKLLLQYGICLPPA